MQLLYADRSGLLYCCLTLGDLSYMNGLSNAKPPSFSRSKGLLQEMGMPVSRRFSA